jgi:hypothetical protein
MAVATGIGIATPKYGEKKTNVAKSIQMMRKNGLIFYALQK